MSKLLVDISYASMQAYEFDGIRNIDEVRKYQYHQVRDFQKNDEASIHIDIHEIFGELTRELSDAYGNGWRNNLDIIVLWSPEFSELQKSEFKQLLLSNGVDNFDFYEPKALSNYLLQRSEKFNSTCSYAINVWSDRSDVYIQLFHYTEDGQYKYIDKTVAEKSAEDPRVPFLTKMMMRELRYNVEEIDSEEPIVRAVAENFIKSGKAVSNEIVTLSSGYQRTFLLTDEYKDCSTNGSDILNKSLTAILEKNHLGEKECQVVLSANFVEKQNLLEVVTRMFTYVCDETAELEDSLLQAAFKQMEYTIRTSQSLQQRIAFCGDGYLMDRPVLITWTCPKCGYSCECFEAPKECPNCHRDEMPVLDVAPVKGRITVKSQSVGGFLGFGSKKSISLTLQLDNPLPCRGVLLVSPKLVPSIPADRMGVYTIDVEKGSEGVVVETTLEIGTLGLSNNAKSFFVKFWPHEDEHVPINKFEIQGGGIVKI